MQDIARLTANTLSKRRIQQTVLFNLCKIQASSYYRAVDNVGEKYISMDGRRISGTITSVKAKRIPDWLGDDEFEACITFKNTGDTNTEYDVSLYSSLGSQGYLIDKEPDTYEVNLRVGESNRLCLTTDWAYPSISDLGPKFMIILRVDSPKEGFIPVDTYVGITP